MGGVVQLPGLNCVVCEHKKQRPAMSAKIEVVDGARLRISTYCGTCGTHYAPEPESGKDLIFKLYTLAL